jgi:hypothetical protein
MGQAATRTRQNRTITVDFHDETTYYHLLGDGKAFLECVLAFLLSLGFQLKHKATCGGGGCLTRHSHYMRVRLGGVTIWRLQCTTCRAVFTVLPHFVLRYRQMRPEIARDALLATHGGLSLEVIVQGVAREGDRGQHALDVFWNVSAFFSQYPVAGLPQPAGNSRSTLPYSWYTPGALAT